MQVRERLTHSYRRWRSNKRTPRLTHTLFYTHARARMYLEASVLSVSRSSPFAHPCSPMPLRTGKNSLLNDATRVVQNQRKRRACTLSFSLSLSLYPPHPLLSSLSLSFSLSRRGSISPTFFTHVFCAVFHTNVFFLVTFCFAREKRARKTLVKSTLVLSLCKWNACRHHFLSYSSLSLSYFE